MDTADLRAKAAVKLTNLLLGADHLPRPTLDGDSVCEQAQDSEQDQKQRAGLAGLGEWR